MMTAPSLDHHTIDDMPIGNLGSINGWFMYRINKEQWMVETIGGYKQECLQYRVGYSLYRWEAILYYDQKKDL